MYIIQTAVSPSSSVCNDNALGKDMYFYTVLASVFSTIFCLLDILSLLLFENMDSVVFVWNVKRKISIWKTVYFSVTSMICTSVTHNKRCCPCLWAVLRLSWLYWHCFCPNQVQLKIFSEPSINIFWLISSGKYLSKAEQLPQHNSISSASLHCSGLLITSTTYKFGLLFEPWINSSSQHISYLYHIKHVCQVQICCSHNPMCGWFCLPTFPKAVSFYVVFHASPPSNSSLCRAVLSRLSHMQESITASPTSSNNSNGSPLKLQAASKKASLDFKIV